MTLDKPSESELTHTEVVISGMYASELPNEVYESNRVVLSGSFFLTNQGYWESYA